MNSRPFNSSRGERSTGTIVLGVLVPAILLVLPVIALHRKGADLRWAAAYVVVMSAFTYWAYARDKRSAQQGEWRTSEAQLHLWELLGGWPGAWMAQRWLRHKCSKGSFQFMFWLIVLGYQLAAFDSFHDWKFSRTGLKWLEQTSGRRR